MWKKRLSLDALTGALVFWAALALVVLFAYLGWVCYIADSEIWSVTLAANITEEWYHFWVFTRPLFYGLLALAEWPTQSPVATFLAARSVFIVNGLLIIYLTFQLARRVSSNKLVPWLSVVLLVGNSGFLNQGFRIRSDLLATSLTLWILCGVFDPEPSPWLWLRFLALPLATPKAIFQMLCLLPFWPRIRPVWLRDPHWLFRVGCLVLAVILGVGASLFHVYGSLFDYFVSTFTPGAGTPPLFSARGFMYVFRILRLNPIFVAGLLLSAFWVLIRRDERGARFAVYLLLLCIWIVFTPEKINFFLASLLPVFCVFSAMWIEDAGRFALVFSVVLVIATWLPASGQFKTIEESDSNFRQLATARMLDQYLSRFPGARFYDVIGVVPKRAKLRYFIGPNSDLVNRESWEMVQRKFPEMVFYVGKLGFLEPKVGAFLRSNYFDFGGGIYGRAYRLRKPIPLESVTAPGDLTNEIRGVSSDLRPGLPEEITMEISPSRGHNYIIKERLDRLGNWFSANRKRFGPAHVARISPFSPPAQILYGSMAQLFKFDSDY